MLLNLYIRNYALIEELRLEFREGLNVFTGETGAGKSIIIESLGLLLGERASLHLIRKGAQSCFVSAEFDCAHLEELKKHLDQSSLASKDDELLLLRREFDISGKSRAFVNDKPVSLLTLSYLGEFLVDVHGQHEHQSLLRNAEQLKLIDRFGTNDELIKNVSENYRVLKELTTQRDSQRISEAERERLIDLYNFQLKEIDDAKIVPSEEEEIENALPELKNAEKLSELAQQAHEILYSTEGSLLEQTGKIQRLLENITNLSGKLRETTETLRSAIYQIEEVAKDTENFKEKITHDPDKLNELLCRQDLISKLKKKYGQTVCEILSYRDKVSAELAALSNIETDREELRKKIDKYHSHLAALCEKLTICRKTSADKLEEKVKRELADLGMTKARFKAQIEKLPEPCANGSDKIEFLLSSNPGEDLKPLKEIASGGEISRIMLSIKTALAKNDQVPVLVFDEIDSGIGGPMGQAVGRKLKNLGKHHQILCITHLPQIASFAGQHISVQKEISKGHTLTKIKTLSEPEHIEEIARMLSGKEITPTASKHAQELIRSARD